VLLFTMDDSRLREWTIGDIGFKNMKWMRILLFRGYDN
jgi:hypothetical protein